MLVRALPPESVTARALHGDRADWGVTEHLLATAIDVLNAANWQRSGDKKLARPKPLPRPTDKRNRLTPDEIRDRLLDQRRRLHHRRR